MNTGNHGHVEPRIDGYQMRCGGPGICRQCTQEKNVFDLAPAVKEVYPLVMANRMYTLLSQGAAKTTSRQVSNLLVDKLAMDRRLSEEFKSVVCINQHVLLFSNRINSVILRHFNLDAPCSAKLSTPSRDRGTSILHKFHADFYDFDYFSFEWRIEISKTKVAI